MRNVAIPISVLALALSGCAGGYDRELLGDPAPVVTSSPEGFTPAKGPIAESTYPDQLPADEALAESEYPDTLPGDEAVEGEYVGTPEEYGMFDELHPYGTWRSTMDFGWVWYPVVSPGWQPFVYGYWIWTSYGWMWVSYEPFGWATYHYGSWWLDPVLGWFWVPGYDWLPCPVDWFYGDGYIGWAPLPPPDCRWEDPWYDGGGHNDGWVVVEGGKFKNPDVGETRIPPQRFKSQYKSGSTATRRAPDTVAIERATKQRVKETDVRIDSERVGSHEKRKVILPPDERRFVRPYPTPAPISQPIAGYHPPVTGGGGGGGGNVVAPPSSSGGSGKVKGSSSPPPSNSGHEKFKSRDTSKGSSSDNSKAKGGGSKDDDKGSGKSKGDSKDDKDDNGKAKGKKR